MKAGRTLRAIRESMPGTPLPSALSCIRGVPGDVSGDDQLPARIEPEQAATHHGSSASSSSSVGISAGKGSGACPLDGVGKAAARMAAQQIGLLLRPEKDIGVVIAHAVVLRSAAVRPRILSTETWESRMPSAFKASLIL